MNANVVARLAPFREAGLLNHMPTRWQVFQGELEMWSSVISTDVTEETRYKGARFGQAFARQPLLFSQIGLDHLRIGSGLGNAHRSLCLHLHYTYHRGMPIWDLQLLQTHENGIAEFRRFTEAVLDGRAPEVQRHLKILRNVLPRHEEYLTEFVQPGGHLDRAEAFDYPKHDNDALPEFFSRLTSFLDHCATTYVATPGEVGVRLPLHVAALATSRFRDGKAFGWFSEA